MEGILSNKAKSGAMEESKQEVEGVPLDGVMRKSWKWRMHSNQKIWNGDKSMDGIGRRVTLGGPWPT